MIDNDTAKTLLALCKKTQQDLDKIKSILEDKLLPEKLYINNYKIHSDKYKKNYDALNKPLYKVYYDSTDHENEMRIHEIMNYVDEFEGYPTEEDIKKAKENFEKNSTEENN